MKNKLSRRAIRIAIAAIAVVALGALLGITELSRHILRDEVSKEAELQAKSVSLVSNAIFLTNEWIVSSFLSGFCDMEKVADDDTFFFKHFIPDSRLKTVDIDELYRSMETFTKYNSELKSVVMIFAPGVLMDYPEGIAACVNEEGSSRLNLLDKTNVFELAFYKAVAADAAAYRRAGFIKENSEWVFTYGMPVFNERNELIGEFWCDSKTSFISKALIERRRNEDLFISVISPSGNIVASSEQQFNGSKLKDLLKSYFQYDLPDENYLNFLNLIRERKHGIVNAVLGGKTVQNYYFPIYGTELSVLISKDYDVIFAKARDFTIKLLLISGCSILMIIIFLLLIFDVIKKQERARWKMEHELNVAASIQSAILPDNPGENGKPAIPGMDVFGFQKQAKSVGGDLYDFADNGRYFHFCIGDVSGNGVPAALLMTQITSSYRYFIQTDNDPASIAAKINGIVMDHNSDRMFATMFIGILDKQTGVLEYCDAGHNPPVITRAGTRNPEFLKMLVNMPVFAYDGYVFRKDSLQLSKGDRLMLYTDGITEAKNEDNRFFGGDATLNALKKAIDSDNKSMVRSLLDEVDAFVGEANQNDDITILCLDYKQ